MGRFTKGHTTNVGRKKDPFSVETKLKMSLAKKGKKLSEAHRKKLSLARMGNKNMLGKKQSLETRRKKSEAFRGEKNHRWKGGRKTQNNIIRRSLEYRLWREAVFKRDNWTCVWCGQRGGSLNADHIKPFSYFPKLRFALDNGRTLCVACHKTTDSYRNNKLTYKK